MNPLDNWFHTRGWQPFDFQQEAWAAYNHGESGLIHASTGTGKTYAVFGGPLIEALNEPVEKLTPLRVLWITPLRALSADTAIALDAPLSALGLPWDVGTRNGDTSSSIRAKQKKRLPTVLVTTPESLSLLLTQDDAELRFAQLRCIVVDEWHELLGSKRGVLTELALARLRTFQPRVRIWGLSATIGNLEAAQKALLGHQRSGVLIRGKVPKPVVIDAILPDQVERFPWAGHLGLSLVQRVAAAIDDVRNALVFTNTRSQSEQWYQALLAARPEWAGQMALHHGSLDRSRRDWVEDHLRDGSLRCVVCTSTLDLGVDFSPVDRVLQIGSPKGVARLMQRAGRSGHQPGATSRVTCVPTSVLELLDVAAARTAAMNGQIEGRVPIHRPLDVLAQHLISTALAGGFRADDLLREVRSTAAYHDLSDAEWDWTLDFVTRGGDALRAYPEYHRLIPIDGVHHIASDKLARRHRMSIGTIAADASAQVRFLRGGRLGSVEESFAARLKKGDVFAFAGRTLEFIRFQEMTVFVRASKKPATTIPRWAGGRLPLSTELASAVRAKLEEVRSDCCNDPEMIALKPILKIQSRRSRIPARDELLVEHLHQRDGYALFIYPFDGRLVHEGLAALLAYRLSARRPQTFSLSVNDYGFSLSSPDEFDLDPQSLQKLFESAGLSDDILESMNATELAKRQFREVARVAGLVNPGLPQAGRSAKQLQASSGLFYEVFREYDPANLLLHQARREVLDRQFEGTRLKNALDRLAAAKIVMIELPKPSPFAFPLLVERMRESISSESLTDRVRRLAANLERGAAIED